MPDQSSVWTLDTAWGLAWRTRYCPPEALVLAESPGAEAQAHLRVCPSCHELAESWRQAGPWSGLASACGWVPEGAAPPPLAIGQLWRLASSLQGWGPKHRHYNPPVVLILREGVHLQNGVLVAQTYHDPLLCGPDDVMLDQERFAQPWNVYTLHRSNLERYCGRVEPEAVGRVLSASRSPIADLSPRSALFLFRQMEIELGFFFSSSAVYALLEEYQALATAQELDRGCQPAEDAGSDKRQDLELQGLLDDLDELRSAILGLGLEVAGGQAGAPAADLYFQAAPPARELPLAAAWAGSGAEIPVLAFKLHQGRPVSCNILEAQVTDYKGWPKVLVGGKFTGPLPPGAKWRAEFRWLDSGGRLVESRASFLEPQDNGSPRFWVLFPLEDPGARFPNSRLRIRLFSKVDHRP